MKITKARVLGFCMGVRRAVELAVEEAKKNKNVYTIGPLIHNPKVLDDLKTLGIKTIDESTLIKRNLCAPCSLLPAPCSLLPTPDSRLPTPYSLIIRAHGISPALEKKLQENNCASKDACDLIDATCPKVKANQLKTRSLAQDGYFIFLAGEKHHAEIEGLVGYASLGDEEANLRFNEINYEEFSSCVITGNSDEARNAAKKLCETNNKNDKPNLKTALLGQTTICEDEYIKIADEIKKYFPDLKIINSICSATGERQTALRELLSQVEAVIIAGGEESANTRRLFAIAKESGKPCALIERAEKIPEDFFAYKTVGISAGASTPDSVVDEIEKMLIKK